MNKFDLTLQEEKYFKIAKKQIAKDMKEELSKQLKNAPEWNRTIYTTVSAFKDFICPQRKKGTYEQEKLLAEEMLHDMKEIEKKLERMVEVYSMAIEAGDVNAD